MNDDIAINSGETLAFDFDAGEEAEDALVIFTAKDDLTKTDENAIVKGSAVVDASGIAHIEISSEDTDIDVAADRANITLSDEDDCLKGHYDVKIVYADTDPALTEIFPDPENCDSKPCFKIVRASTQGIV